jgi:hypothetical protein
MRGEGMRKSLFLPQNILPMNFTFFHRPERRKYNYKPQFYTPEEEKSTDYEKFDRDKFGEKLSRSWDSKRRTRTNSTGNMRIIIWLVFLIAILLLVIWKFL